MEYLYSHGIFERMEPVIMSEEIGPTLTIGEEILNPTLEMVLQDQESNLIEAFERENQPIRLAIKHTKNFYKTHEGLFKYRYWGVDRKG